MCVHRYFPEETPHGNARDEPQQQAVDQQYLDRGTDHHRQRQPADIDEHGRAVRGDRIGDQCEHAERRRLHHDADDLEQHRRGRLEQAGEGPPRFPGDERADAEQDRDEDDRKHVALGERLEDVDRDDADQLIVRRRRNADGVRRGGAERRALARPDEARHRPCRPRPRWRW